ncbi:WD40-repeat-containing domain protein [Cladorrhinum samala]|uniref:WD40-repeat-containing domain protein n=1 Tax=Cladorrhinum samala TaxID=585594 RepID=A0AAV9HEQ2_9PEZI|nr:WD40-repeat-containing domain protein [Cladorrhinum samala]
MFDVGGIPLALSWAPLTSRTRQVLAVATVPFADQESNPLGEVNMNKTAMTNGSVQLWEFMAEEADEGLATPSTKPPRFLGAKCFDWGRPKRLQFCPVTMNASDLHNTYGMLAVLCSDGRVRIMDTNAIHDSPNPIFEWMESPVVTFGLDNDYNIEITCLTWVNTNRIAFGHTDGSITLWSVYPKKLLQRHGVHTTYVIDICSAYPSSPSLVASIPVGGCATLTDLYQPSSEFTYFPVPAISFQPNLLCWNESMQGFMALYPSSTPNTTIAFLHHRFFCQARSICTGPNTLTCVSAGSTHPFILVGCADGSVFSCNALQKLFKQKGEPLRKIKIFEHEYKPIEHGAEDSSDAEIVGGEPRPRGAVRILQGFLPEVNDDPRTEKRKEMDRKKRLERKNNGKKRGRPKKSGGAMEEALNEEEDREGELEERLASRVVTHEPLTRVTAVAWNPNTHFSCWAACAMGSGLIKIMDLGVE